MLEQATILELVRYAGLMLTRITPIRAVAYCISTHSARFGAQIPTRSPFFTPRTSRPRATFEVSSQNWR